MGNKILYAKPFTPFPTLLEVLDDKISKLEEDKRKLINCLETILHSEWSLIDEDFKKFIEQVLADKDGDLMP